MLGTDLSDELTRLVTHAHSHYISLSVGGMTKLENFEAYHNQFTHHLPSELGLPSIKRIGKSGVKTRRWIVSGSHRNSDVVVV